MLTDVSQWEAAARAHGDFFAAIRPATTFVEVQGFINREWLVEVEADCIHALKRPASKLLPRVRTCWVTPPLQKCCGMACPWSKPVSSFVTAAST
jgi:hypothetical protein